MPSILIEFIDRRPGRDPAPEGADAYELLTERVEFEVETVLASDAVELTPEQEIRKHVVTFRCVACHQRGDLGGISELRDQRARKISG